MSDATGPLVGLSPVAAAPTARKVREARLDVFRGICLVMIFINHVPGNTLEKFTSRNFGFSDAAEGFVMMSGIAAGLAYSADFGAPMRLARGLGRVWARCWTLYMVQMLMTLTALAVAAAVSLISGDARILFQNDMGWLWNHPLETLIGLPLMIHQFDYLNILPLYIVLLFVSPVLMIAAHRAPMVLLSASLAVWAVCGTMTLNLPTWPNDEGWMFDPLTWQVVFVVGLLIGVAMRRGERFVPVRGWLVAASAGYLVLALVVARWRGFADVFGAGLWILKADLGVPWIFTDFDKIFVTAPRLLHILALTYIISAVPLMRRLCAHPFAAPLSMLGRQSLPVFAFGSVMAIGLQGVFNAIGHDPVTDTLLIGAGIILLFALALARVSWSARQA